MANASGAEKNPTDEMSEATAFTQVVHVLKEHLGFACCQQHKL